MRIRTERFKTLVILDEVHHAGDALSWGEGVREAFQPAHRRLALTGTPFRSDINPIPFVTYAPGADGVPRSRRRLHLRLRARARRPRGAAGAVPGLLRRDAVAHPRGRRGGRPARRAADPGPQRAGPAHRPGPGRRVDPVGAGRGRHPAHRGTPPRARRRRPGDRHRPGLGAGVRHAAQADHRRGAHRRAVRREDRVEEDRGLHRLRRPLDGRRADGVRGRRRAAAGRRRLRDDHLDAAVLRPGGGPVRAGPGPRRDRVGVPAVGALAAGVRRRAGARSATTCSAAGSTPRTTSSPPRPRCSPGRRPGSRPPTTCSGRSRRWARRPSSTRCSSTARVRPRRRGARRVRGGDGLPRHPRPARARPGPRPAAPAPERPSAAGRRGADPVADRSPRTSSSPSLRRELNGLVAAWHHRTGQPHGVTHAELRSTAAGRPPPSPAPTSSASGSPGCASWPPGVPS